MRKTWRAPRSGGAEVVELPPPEIVTERLLDHDAGAAALDVGVEARAAQTRDHGLEELWQRQR